MNTIDLDSISLEQALLDFEVANARVMDLTARLTSMSRELLAARTELELARFEVSSLKAAAAEPPPPPPEDPELTRLRDEVSQLRDVVSQLRASRAVRIASLFSGNLRRIL